MTATVNNIFMFQCGRPHSSLKSFAIYLKICPHISCPTKEITVLRMVVICIAISRLAAGFAAGKNAKANFSIHDLSFDDSGRKTVLSRAFIFNSQQQLSLSLARAFLRGRGCRYKNRGEFRGKRAERHFAATFARG